MVKKKRKMKATDKISKEIVAVLEISQLPDEIIMRVLAHLDNLIEKSKDMKSRVDLLNDILEEMAYS